MKELHDEDFVTVGTELLALEERVFELSARIDRLSDLYFDEAHQVKMMDLIEMDYRMEELEKKYDGLLAHVGNNLPIINQIEKFLKQAEGNKRGRY